MIGVERSHSPTPKTRSRALSPHLTPGRGAAVLAACALLLAALTLLSPAPAYAEPPAPPSATEAAELLDGLTVAEPGSGDGYDRDKFPHWSDQGDNCDTRDAVLKRDGEGVEVDDECEPTAGRWYSVYDATWVENDSDIQIDHIVPLSEAWKSGADAWTTERREQFANDLEISQLVAVSGSSNQDKSDSDPAEWTPSDDSVHCVYAREWIWVKSTYEMTVDEAEKGALSDLLGTC